MGTLALHQGGVFSLSNFDLDPVVIAYPVISLRALVCESSD